MKKLGRMIRQKAGQLLYDHKVKQSLDLASLNKILFMQVTGKIGDLIANTHAIREIKETYPNVQIDVVCSKSNVDIIKENPYVSNIILFTPSTLNDLNETEYDLFYYHREELHYFNDYAMLNKIGAKVNIGRNKPNLNLIDISINGDFSNKREIDKYNALLDVLHIKPKQEKYDIFLNNEEINAAQNQLSSDKPNIVFNRFGANKRRSFNTEISLAMCKLIKDVIPNANIIFISPPDKRDELNAFVAQLDHTDTCIPNINSIRESAGIVHEADLIISPETSIIHIACAFEKPQIAIYRNQNILWHPISKNADIIYSQNRSKKDVNTINLDDFKKSLQQFAKNNP